jgi:hypothetical protein
VGARDRGGASRGRALGSHPSRDGGPEAGYDGYRWLDTRNAAQLEPLLRALYREFGCEDRVKEVALEP